MGKYIVLEGGDGVGKSTQSKRLVDYINSLGMKAVWTREPGSPLIDLNVRELVLSDFPIGPRTLELLMQADRAEHSDKIDALLKDGYWVVSDRSYISGLAYGKSNNHREDYLYSIMNFALGNVRPHFIIMLDLDPKVLIERRKERGVAETREEMKGINFEISVRENLKYFISKEDKINSVPNIVIDGNKSPENIFELIVEFIGLPNNSMSRS